MNVNLKRLVLAAVVVFSVVFFFQIVISAPILSSTGETIPTNTNIALFSTETYTPANLSRDGLTIQSTLGEGTIQHTDVVGEVSAFVGQLDDSQKENIATAKLFLDDQLISTEFEMDTPSLLSFPKIPNPVPATDGMHTTRIDVTTSLGRQASETKTITMDTKPPALSLISQNEEQFSFRIVDETSLIQRKTMEVLLYDTAKDYSRRMADASITCTPDQGKTMECSFVVQHSPTETIVLFASDAAGNVSDYSFGEPTRELSEKFLTTELQKMGSAPASVSPAFSTQSSAVTAACEYPPLEFYIFHTGNDYPNLGYSMQAKVDATRQAYDTAINTIWPDFFTSKGIDPPAFGQIPVKYYLVVPQGTNTSSITGIDDVKTIPSWMMPPSPSACGGDGSSNVFKTCFQNVNLSPIIGGTGITETWARKKISEVSIFEDTYKTADNMVVVVNDWIDNQDGQLPYGKAFVSRGTAYLAYVTHYSPTTLAFQQSIFSVTLAHELGHLWGLGHNDHTTTALMNGTNTGGLIATRLEEPARVKAVMCSDGLVPAEAGKIARGSTGTCGDGLLDSLTTNDEQCETNFSGYTPDGALITKPITQFCALYQDLGRVIVDPPWAVGSGYGPHGVGQTFNQFPNSQVYKCSTINCKCVVGGLVIGPPTIIPPIPTCTGTACSSPPHASTPASAPGGNPNHCNTHEPERGGDPTSGIGYMFCPADAWCPDGEKCAIHGDDCRCIPEEIVGCGNGVIESGPPSFEACDPPGSWCSDFVGGSGTCDASCQCDGLSNPGAPNATPNLSTNGTLACTGKIAC